jgi:hypothetical protein
MKVLVTTKSQTPKVFHYLTHNGRPACGMVRKRGEWTAKDTQVIPHHRPCQTCEKMVADGRAEISSEVALNGE